MKGKRVLKKQRKLNNTLSTYFMSLFSVLLSFVMLLGTTFAWFYTDNTSTGNEIHSGTLKVDMIHDGVSLDENELHSVFSDQVWQPGDVQVETVTVENKGNIPLNYKLSFAPVSNSGSAVDVTDLFTVYVKEGGVAKAERTRLLANGPVGEDDWGAPLGTLDTFLSVGSEKLLCQSEEPLEPKETREISIALQMKPPQQVSFTAMEQSVSIWLKLEATQVIADES